MSKKSHLQVEPYQEKLIQIHELLAAGHPRAEVEPRPEFREIYAAESAASRTLLNFYAAAHTAPFQRVVAAVKEFARTDAARFPPPGRNAGRGSWRRSSTNFPAFTWRPATSTCF
jgi:hypothetical protein